MGATNDDAPILNKQKTMDTFKVMQDLQMESMDVMMASGMGAQPTNE